MSVGFGQSKADIDARAGNVCLALRNALADVQAFAAFLAGKQTGDLTALTYTADEAAELKTNFAILDQFRSAFQGGQAIPAAVDLRPFVAPFTGVV